MELDKPFGFKQHLVVPIPLDPKANISSYKINSVKQNMIKKSDIMILFSNLKLNTMKDRNGKTYLNFPQVYTYVVNNAF